MGVGEVWVYKLSGYFILEVGEIYKGGVGKLNFKKCDIIKNHNLFYDDM